MYGLALLLLFSHGQNGEHTAQAIFKREEALQTLLLVDIAKRTDQQSVKTRVRAGIDRTS